MSRDPRREQERQAIARLGVSELQQLRAHALARIEEIDAALKRHGVEPQKDTLSILAFARRLGVNEAAVRKAVDNGRLERSVGRDPHGRAFIKDVALGEQEWRDNKDHARDRGVVSIGTIAKHKTGILFEQRRKLRLANDERSGKLVNARQAELRETGRVITAKNRLLGLPAKAKQRLPSLSIADVGVLDELVRECLDGLASRSQEPDGEDSA